MQKDELQPGDLVFRYRGDTTFAGAVSAVVGGWRGHDIYHVGLYEGRGLVWEAGKEGVRRVRVSSWQGGLLAGRLTERWTRSHPQLVPRALAWTRKRNGLPYNDTFDQRKISFYCSELVVDAFRHAGAAVFPETPLTFRDPETDRLLPYWEQYYSTRGLSVPEGKPGSHPAALSLSEELEIDLLT